MTGTASPGATLNEMAKQSKKPADLNRLAAAIVGDATDEERPAQDDGKDPAAVALGRKGGEKGGKVRASRMTAEERSEAAKKAARARWGT